MGSYVFASSHSGQPHNARPAAILCRHTRPLPLQEHENEQAEIVIVCEPQGTSLMMGGLHPRASLYERPVNLDAAKAAHAHFRRVMREAGVKVSFADPSVACCRENR